MGSKRGEEQGEDGRAAADAEDAQGDGQHGQGRNGVADVEELHEAFGAADHGRAAEEDAGGNAHDKGGQHGSEDENQMSLQVKQQIVAVVFDRVDADPVDQQGQKGEYQRASYQPFAIADSHRRTPFFSRRTQSRVAMPFLAAEKMIARSSSCRARSTVGASLLAKNVKIMRTFRYPHYR